MCTAIITKKKKPNRNKLARSNNENRGSQSVTDTLPVKPLTQAVQFRMRGKKPQTLVA